MIENIFVCSLCLLCIAIWATKIRNQISKIIKAPNGKQKSNSELQRYIFVSFLIIIAYGFIIVIFHLLNVQIGSLFSRLNFLAKLWVDITGFLLGVIGLAICFISQREMGLSWRVGIDHSIKTDLVKTGLFKFIRNPTYLGLFLMNLGIWFIWPSWTVFLFGLLFFIFLEIQVRREEEYLQSVHSKAYTTYKKNTKRYIPFIY